jgi:hypothetical protein
MLRPERHIDDADNTLQRHPALSTMTLTLPLGTTGMTARRPSTRQWP